MRIGALLTLVLVGCGYGSSAGVIPDARPSDARTVDAPPACSVQISFSPAAPVAPATIAAHATVVAGPATFHTLNWNLAGPDGPIAPTVTDNAGLSVTFRAEQPGPYHASVSLEGAICQTGNVTLNVAAPMAQRATFRLRLTPLLGQGLPPQLDQTIQVSGGADYALPGNVALVAGTAVTGQVRGPGAGLGAYLRVDADRPALAELYADATGHFSALLPPGSFSVLVVPTDGGLPPLRLGATPASLAAGLVLDAGDAVSGTVSAADGAAQGGARVAIGAGALPPILTAAGADGAFSARLRVAAGPLHLTVVPASGAARLELGVGDAVAIAPGAQLALTFPAFDLVSVAPRLVAADGSDLTNATVTWVDAGDQASGILVVDSGAARPVRVAVRGLWLGDGAIELPRGRYHAVVDPGAASGQALGLVDVDLAAGPPAELAAAAPSVTVVTVSGAGAPVAGARVYAVAKGAYGVGAGVTVSAATGAGGVARLGLAPGAAYQLVIEPPAALPLARARATVIGGAGATVTLPRAIHITGTVVSPSGPGQAGVHVALLCGACTGPDADTPLDETTTATGGGFDLAAPDPGAGP
jgi:hypothetical protein